MKMAHYAINLSKDMQYNLESPSQYARKVANTTTNQMSQGMPFDFTMLGQILVTEAAFGPFEKLEHAKFMPPSELDEKNRDWKGQRWTFVTIPMFEFEKTTQGWADSFFVPDWTVQRVWICTTCEARQAFKGSCAKCKMQGMEFQKTIEVKDWDGDLIA